MPASLTYTHTHTLAHTHTHKNIHTRIHARTHVYTHTHTCTRTHTHTHAHAHTRTHTLTHHVAEQTRGGQKEEGRRGGNGMDLILASHTHTHTHTRTHTRTHTHTHTLRPTRSPCELRKERVQSNQERRCDNNLIPTSPRTKQTDPFFFSTIESVFPQYTANTCVCQAHHTGVRTHTHTHTHT